LRHPDRLTVPLVRKGGSLAPASWEEAFNITAAALQKAQVTHGPASAGVFGSGSLTNEKAYLLGKFARVALRTPNVDYNGRFCMSSAAAASIKALGLDRGLPFPVEDITKAEVVLLCGANVAETMPPIMHYFDVQRANGGEVIVADPRRTETAKAASLHLRLRPGTDAALANGIMHVLVRDRLIDEKYIAQRTENFASVRAAASAYWPERVERITGVPESDIVRAARLLGVARTAMVLTARGAEQQSHGVENVLAFINIALATGRVGRPHSGYGCITGQTNGQGGREHGQKADQLPGYRRISDPAARRHVAQVWRVPENEIPGPGLSAYEMLSSMGGEGGVRALLVFGSNVTVSSPNARLIEDRLSRLDFLAVSDFFLSETASLAHVVFPSAQWAEEDGTVTNLEGRVIRRRLVFPPPAGVKTDLEILCGLADRMGKGVSFRYSSARDVFDELRRASEGGPADYSGITYERIETENGVFWPCPKEGHPGTPRMFADGFPTPSGRARFHAVRHLPPAEETDQEFPLLLTTGRLKVHYQSGTQTRRVERLSALARRPLAEMNPSTAARHGLSEDSPVTLSSRRGTATFKLKTTVSVPAGLVFVPFHWGGPEAVNRLTNPALDPASKMPEFKVCAVNARPAGGD
jgi:assimilatory nitrate reductase catalytic subunit